jgi:hypothetical protein
MPHVLRERTRLEATNRLFKELDVVFERLTRQLSEHPEFSIYTANPYFQFSDRSKRTPFIDTIEAHNVPQYRLWFIGNFFDVRVAVYEEIDLEHYRLHPIGDDSMKGNGVFHLAVAKHGYHNTDPSLIVFETIDRKKVLEREWTVETIDAVASILPWKFTDADFDLRLKKADFARRSAP